MRVCSYGFWVKRAFKHTDAQNASMGRMTIVIPDRVEKELRVKVAEKYGGRKGALGDAIAEAIQKWVKEK